MGIGKGGALSGAVGGRTDRQEIRPIGNGGGHGDETAVASGGSPRHSQVASVRRSLFSGASCGQ